MTTIGTFQVGQEITITAVFRTKAGAATDPTEVQWRILHGDGKTIDTYGLASPQVVRTAVGTYELTFVAANHPGRWFSRPESGQTGVGLIAAAENDFMVAQSAFAAP